MTDRIEGEKEIDSSILKLFLLGSLMAANLQCIDQELRRFHELSMRLSLEEEEEVTHQASPSRHDSLPKGTPSTPNIVAVHTLFLPDIDSKKQKHGSKILESVGFVQALNLTCP